ncbi:PIG-L family deacetylase [Hydrogenophaga sp.]|uniref:PIG-L deacetylase family protein n=1 Tax=Hydrogenophaga sp. TaxID=1904254 RepID=UPI002B91A908|nr:PIG-L family deacetylase [Hydrogenophaga sp.]HMP09490.1 PIG-L family deacetylase [Hydrogenophaga sp.]
MSAGRAGLPCCVVAVTDGEASHPGSLQWPPERLARERMRESARALAVLDPQARLHRLGLPDGRVADHTAALASALRHLLRPGDAVFCTWRMDGHPDHEATGHVCATVIRPLGCRLFEVPVWTWHWAGPGDWRVPWHRSVTLPVAPPLLALKRQALACFQTQLKPDPTTGKAAILPEWATQRLLRHF